MQLRSIADWTPTKSSIGYAAKALTAAAIAIGSLGVATAVAQPARVPAGNERAGAADGQQVDFRKSAQLSGPEQLSEADKSLGKLEAGASGIRKQLEQARKEKDVVKVLCLDDKLSQADVATRSGRERRASLQAAVTSRNAELANHEFTVLQVLRQRGEQVVAEANQCIGEEAAYTGESKVVVTIDPDVSRSEEGRIPPMEGPISYGGIVAPPQCVSCTR
jgi:hypothetical protein